MSTANASGEYGIFSDEGLLEGGFYSPANAEIILYADYDEGFAHIAEICLDHPDQEAENCELCNQEEDDV